MGKKPRKNTVEALRQIRLLCPNANDSNCYVSSDETTRYNCVALALGDEMRWWEPTPGAQYYWPTSKNRDYSIGAYIAMFASLGFVACETSNVEDRYEKVVIYADSSNEFRHVALQSRTGGWVSKLGDLEDVEHDSPEVLESDIYGTPRMFMRRELKDQLPLM